MSAYDIALEEMKDEMQELRRSIALLQHSFLYREIDVKEVAQIKGLSEETVRQRARDCQLPVIPGSRPKRFIYFDIITGQDVCSHGRLEAELKAQAAENF